MSHLAYRRCLVLFELTTFIALANLYARSNVALGVESDGFAAACGLKPLAKRPANPIQVASAA